jgi:aryl-alcohol dehydrogenase-like predicted oxidoreductase
MPLDSDRLDRRGFLKTTAAGLGAAAVGAGMLHAEEEKSDAPQADAKDLDVRTKAPTMEYRRLGRTNYLCSRIVEGYAGGPELWRRLLARGVNYWDTGRGYGNHEVELKPFLKDNRDKLWITSKATGVAGYNKVDDGVREIYLTTMKAYLGEKFDGLNTAYRQDRGKDLLRFHLAALEKEKVTGQKPDFRPAGRRISELYAAKLDQSLDRMGIDHVDCYFMHGVELPWLWQCTEVW